MNQLSRVVWREGMHLTQHHFQAQGRYFENAMTFALSQLFFAPYGIAGLTLDAEALRNGTAVVLHARGVFPDGLPFAVPDADDAPAPRAIDDLFSPVRDGHILHLAIPAYRENGANVADDGARFSAQHVTMPDETFGRDERAVTVGRRNLRLLLDVELEAAGAVVALPLARIKRDGAGRYVYDDSFVPPTLQVGASERLLAILKRLVDVVDAKRQSLGASVGADGADVEAVWLAHTLSAALPGLRHLLAIRTEHPERLYAELSRLAGALCTFALDSPVTALPPYAHDDLGGCFDALDRHVRSHLELVSPTSALRIPLERTAEGLLVGQIVDSRALATARWFIGVRAELSMADLLDRVPRFVKVCSARFVAELVRRALPGMTLTHVATPPSAIAPRAGFAYFSVTTAGPCWDHLRATSEVGVYASDDVPGAVVDVVVIPA